MHSEDAASADLLSDHRFFKAGICIKGPVFDAPVGHERSVVIAGHCGRYIHGDIVAPIQIDDADPKITQGFFRKFRKNVMTASKIRQGVGRDSQALCIDERSRHAAAEIQAEILCKNLLPRFGRWLMPE